MVEDLYVRHGSRPNVDGIDGHEQLVASSCALVVSDIEERHRELGELPGNGEDGPAARDPRVHRRGVRYLANDLEGGPSNLLDGAHAASLDRYLQLVARAGGLERVLDLVGAVCDGSHGRTHRCCRRAWLQICEGRCYEVGLVDLQVREGVAGVQREGLFYVHDCKAVVQVVRE